MDWHLLWLFVNPTALAWFYIGKWMQRRQDSRGARAGVRIERAIRRGQRCTCYRPAERGHHCDG